MLAFILEFVIASYVSSCSPQEFRLLEFLVKWIALYRIPLSFYQLHVANPNDFNNVPKYSEWSFKTDPFF